MNYLSTKDIIGVKADDAVLTEDISANRSDDLAVFTAVAKSNLQIFRKVINSIGFTQKHSSDSKCCSGKKWGMSAFSCGGKKFNSNN